MPMYIKDGYWNYYLAFRIKKPQKTLLNKLQNGPFSGLAAIIANNAILHCEPINELLKQRLSDVTASQQKLTGNESVEELHKRYNADELPECFFDFDLSTNDDQLLNAINKSILDVVHIRDRFYQTFRFQNEAIPYYFVLLPIKVYFSERNYIYCPVYVQLLSNGSGIIKVAIPIHNVHTEGFSAGNIQRWFSYIKVWDSLFNGNSKSGYKIVSHDSDGVMDITASLINYVNNIFSDAVVNTGFFIGSETFVLSNCSNNGYDIINSPTNDPKFLAPIYHFVFPEEHLHDPSKNELQEFWANSYYDMNGLKTVISSNQRLIIYADVSKLMRQNKEHDITDKNEYLQMYSSITCDQYISLVTMQKQNDALIFNLAKHDQRTINSVMRQYYTDANYFDALLVNVRKHEFYFYKKLKEALGDISIDFHEMLNRIQLIEQHEESAFNERRAILLNCFALVFTVLFGFPLIHDTLGLLKQIIIPSHDLIPFLTVDSTSIIVWVFLALSMVFINVKGSPNLKQFELKIKNLVIYRKFKRLPWFKQ